MLRITHGTIGRNVQEGIGDNLRRLDESMRMLADGKRIQAPSDDPAALSQALRLRGEGAAANQFVRNVEDGLGRMTATESALVETNSVFQRVRELSLQAANDTYSPAERAYTLSEVQQLTRQLAALAATSFKGEYLFSGTRTEVAPFSIIGGFDEIRAAAGPNGTSLVAVPATVPLWDLAIDDSGTASGDARARLLIPGTVRVEGLTEGTDFEIDHENASIRFLSAAAVTQAASPDGIRVSFEWIRRETRDIDQEIVREVGQDVSVMVNITASAAFGTPGSNEAFAALVRIMEGLHRGEGQMVRNNLAGLDRGRERALEAQTTAGSRSNRLESALTLARSHRLSLTEERSRIEDADYASVISEFQERQQVYEASLRVGARIIQPSLLDFL